MTESNNTIDLTCPASTTELHSKAHSVYCLTQKRTLVFALSTFVNLISLKADLYANAVGSPRRFIPNLAKTVAIFIRIRQVSTYGAGNGDAKGDICIGQSAARVILSVVPKVVLHETELPSFDSSGSSRQHPCADFGSYFRRIINQGSNPGRSNGVLDV